MSRFAASTPQIKNFMASTPGYDALGNLLQSARSQERAYSTAEQAQTRAAGLDAMAKVKTAKYQGKATIAQARAGAAATQAQGFSNMMGSIAGGIGKIKIPSGNGGFGTVSTTPGDFGYTPSIPSFSTPSSLDFSGLY